MALQQLSDVVYIYYNFHSLKLNFQPHICAIFSNKFQYEGSQVNTGCSVGMFLMLLIMLKCKNAAAETHKIERVFLFATRLEVMFHKKITRFT